MATVEDLVRKLGRPPREICLDWVWQIEHFPIASENESKQALKLSMADIDVDDTGQLQLRNQESLHYSPQELLEELKQWSAQSPTNQSESTRGAAIFEEERFNGHTSSPSVRKSSGKTRRTDTLRMQVVVAAVALILVVFGLIAWTGSSDPIATRDGGNRSENVAKQESQALEDFPLQSSSHSAFAETLETLKAPEPELGLSDAPDVNQSPLANLGSKLLELFASDGTNHSKTEDLATGKMPQKEAKENSLIFEVNDTTAQAMAERDVMKEATEIVQGAAKDAIETDIKEPESGSLPNEPIVIQTSPMVQVMKFASKTPNLSRQSTWKLELMVDDGFVVTPSEPQQLKERQTISWNIAMDDAELPVTRIAITVDIPPRQTSLRWRIVATADDLPQLILPLDVKLLQTIQDRMRIFSLQADRTIDTLKQSANSLPREMRSLAAQQRSALEVQSKLAKRLLTIASEASLINDQLHGHLSVRTSAPFR